MAMAATATPTPMPAAAPVLSPDEDEDDEDEGEAAAEVLLDVAVLLLDVVVSNCAPVVVDVLLDEVDVDSWT